MILPPSVIPALLGALRDNLNLYQNQFGPPPSLRPNTPGTPPPSIEDIYSQLKLPDDQLSGEYANAALIAHTQSEFCIDFITNFYPRSAVACRVYLAAPQVPVLWNTLAQSYQQFQQKVSGQAHRPPEHPPSPS